MSVSQIAVNVEKEVDDFLVGIRDLVIAAKAGKVDLGAELAVVIKLVNEVPQIPADLSADLCGTLRSGGVRLAEIVSVLKGVYIS